MKKLKNGMTIFLALVTFSNVNAYADEFVDVKPYQWYYEAVTIMANKKILAGVSDNEFAPSNSVTRGEFIYYLKNLSENDEEYNYTPFSDVYANNYYSSAITWAYEKEIVTLAEDGIFDPDRMLTKQEMAVIIYNL